jgi:hypothetical protein
MLEQEVTTTWFCLWSNEGSSLQLRQIEALYEVSSEDPTSNQEFNSGKVAT